MNDMELVDLYLYIYISVHYSMVESPWHIIVDFIRNMNRVSLFFSLSLSHLSGLDLYIIYTDELDSREQYCL